MDINKNQKLGQRFLQERVRLGYMNQYKLSRALGVAHTTIRNVELDGCVPGGEILKAFATLGADVHYILTGDRSPGFDHIASGEVTKRIDLRIYGPHSRMAVRLHAARNRP